MAVNLSIKNVPDHLAERLRDLAARNHRSLQGQLMVILENAVHTSDVERARAVREPSPLLEEKGKLSAASLASVIEELAAVRARTKRGREPLVRLRDAGRRM